MNHRRFFIAGCQRSGTTLTRLILESHPQIFCLDETRSYKALEGEPVAMPENKTRLGFKIPRWTERLGDSGGGLPTPAFYQGEPVFFLLRDVRDTIASMMTLKAGSDSSWLTAWGVPILEQRLAEDPELCATQADKIAILRASGNAPAAVGAMYWLYKTLAYFRYVKQGWPVLGVRYETLVAEPVPRLKAMLDAIGLPWDDAVLHHTSIKHDELFPDGTTVGGTDPARPIATNSVGRWRDILSPDDETLAMKIAGNLNEQIAQLD